MNAANVATKMKFENCLSSNKFLGKKELKSFFGLEQIIEFSFELLGKNDFLQVEFLTSRIGQNDDLTQWLIGNVARNDLLIAYLAQLAILHDG